MPSNTHKSHESYHALSQFLVQIERCRKVKSGQNGAFLTLQCLVILLVFLNIAYCILHHAVPGMCIPAPIACIISVVRDGMKPRESIGATTFKESGIPEEI